MVAQEVERRASKAPQPWSAALGSPNLSTIWLSVVWSPSADCCCSRCLAALMLPQYTESCSPHSKLLFCNIGSYTQCSSLSRKSSKVRKGVNVAVNRPLFTPFDKEHQVPLTHTCWRPPSSSLFSSGVSYYRLLLESARAYDTSLAVSQTLQEGEKGQHCTNSLCCEIATNCERKVDRGDRKVMNTHYSYYEVFPIADRIQDVRIYKIVSPNSSFIQCPRRTGVGA